MAKGGGMKGTKGMARGGGMKGTKGMAKGGAAARAERSATGFSNMPASVMSALMGEGTRKAGQANVLKGNRPSFIKAAKSDSAKTMYEKFLKQLNENLNTELKSGVFGADMLINLSNDGPVTILYDSNIKLKK